MPTDEASAWTEQLQVFCVDVGSIARGKFGWARRHPPGEDEEVHEPGRIESLAAALSYCLRHERPIALGLEMPLFLPVPKDSRDLGKARAVDLNAPAWSSSIGASALATGTVQLAWLLANLREQMPVVPLFLRWEPFAEARAGLLLWEAFVTGDAKGASHEEDALVGIDAFCARLPDGLDGADLERSLSLAAAIAYWAGWDLSPAQLREPGIVVRA
jgi:hypothetical protein